MGWSIPYFFEWDLVWNRVASWSFLLVFPELAYVVLVACVEPWIDSRGNAGWPWCLGRWNVGVSRQTPSISWPLGGYVDTRTRSSRRIVHATAPRRNWGRIFIEWF